jgi:hypothetical protein
MIDQLPFAGRSILAIVYGTGDEPDLLLAALSDRLQGLDHRLSGLVQRTADRSLESRCNMLVELLPSGERLPISENRGRGARGCRLDYGQLVDALSAAEAGLDAGTDLMILNRFGKVEAEGSGGRALIARAVELGVPVLVAVPWRNIAAFRAFAGDLAAEVGLADFVAGLPEAARSQLLDRETAPKLGSIA